MSRTLSWLNKGAGGEWSEGGGVRGVGGSLFYVSITSLHFDVKRFYNESYYILHFVGWCYLGSRYKSN